jgi:hypothetical protein
MAETSEARKRREARVGSALQAALEDVYGGDQQIEAGAVEDKLYDRGYAVVPVGFACEVPER